MIPRGAPIIRSNYIFREYAMFCLGRFVSQAVGEQTISFGMSESTAIEVCYSLNTIEVNSNYIKRLQNQQLL